MQALPSPLALQLSTLAAEIGGKCEWFQWFICHCWMMKAKSFLFTLSVAEGLPDWDRHCHCSLIRLASDEKRRERDGEIDWWSSRLAAVRLDKKVAQWTKICLPLLFFNGSPTYFVIVTARLHRGSSQMKYSMARENNKHFLNQLQLQLLINYITFAKMWNRVISAALCVIVTEVHSVTAFLLLY